jgi:hypothetical protein
MALSSIASAILQLGVLVFEAPQPAGIRHLQPAELRFPVVERDAADPALSPENWIVLR